MRDNALYRSSASSSKHRSVFFHQSDRFAKVHRKMTVPVKQTAIKVTDNQTNHFMPSCQASSSRIA